MGSDELQRLIGRNHYIYLIMNEHLDFVVVMGNRFFTTATLDFDWKRLAGDSHCNKWFRAFNLWDVAVPSPGV